MNSIDSADFAVRQMQKKSGGKITFMRFSPAGLWQLRISSYCPRWSSIAKLCTVAPVGDIHRNRRPEPTAKFCTGPHMNNQDFRLASVWDFSGLARAACYSAGGRPMPLTDERKASGRHCGANTRWLHRSTQEK